MTKRRTWSQSGECPVLTPTSPPRDVAVFSIAPPIGVPFRYCSPSAQTKAPSRATTRGRLPQGINSWRTKPVCGVPGDAAGAKASIKGASGGTPEHGAPTNVVSGSLDLHNRALVQQEFRR